MRASSPLNKAARAMPRAGLSIAVFVAAMLPSCDRGVEPKQWGEQKESWVDFSDNPVLSGADPALHARWIFGPQILNDGGTYRMWYNNTTPTSDTRVISYVYSMDGNTWNSGSPTSVLEPGTAQDWDYSNVVTGPVIKENGIFRMYYSNTSNHGNARQIGLATSVDGVHWDKYGSPILSPSRSWERQIGASDVLKVDGVYFLYYCAIGPLASSIGLATSTDGTSFTKYSERPILEGTQWWENGGVCAPSVLLDNGTYIMVYAVGDGSGLGMATSTDGKKWTKNADNPFFTTQDVTNGWTKNNIAYICFRKIGSEYRIYYSGYNATTNRWMVGYAKKE